MTGILSDSQTIGLLYRHVGDGTADGDGVYPERFVNFVADTSSTRGNVLSRESTPQALGVMRVVTSRAEWLSRFRSNRFRRLSREFFWIGLGQAGVASGAIVGVRLLTGVLTPGAYGELALGISVASLVGQAVLGPLTNGATRFFAPACEARRLPAYLAVVKTLVLQATGLISLAAIVLCLGLLVAGQSDWIGLAMAAACFGLLSGYNSVLSGMQNAARQRAIVALHQALASWGRFLLAAGMAVWLGNRSTMAMLGYALALLIVLVSQGWFFSRMLSLDGDCSGGGPTDQGRWRAEILSYAWPSAVWGIPAWTQLVSDRWALQVFSSTEEVGRYAALYQLGYYPITMVTGMVVQLVCPVFFQRAGDASEPARVSDVHHRNGQLVLAALLLTGAAVLSALGLHRPVFHLLVAPEYRTVSWLLPWVVLAGGLFASGELAAVSMLSGNNTRSLLAPKIAAAVVGVLLNALGAAWWGIPGVVAATAATSGMYLLWVLLITRAWHDRQYRRKDNDLLPNQGVAETGSARL